MTHSGDHANSAGQTFAGMRYSLDPVFYPRSLLLINAFKGQSTTAETVWKNISGSFIHGQFRRLCLNETENAFDDSLIPEETDLAVILAPSDRYAELVAACDKRKVRGAILLSPDQREPGTFAPAGDLHEVIAALPNGLRVVGPQSYGVIVPHHDLNVSALSPMPRAGSIAFISQSGALCSAVLDWSFRTGMGFSAIVSSGIMADVNWHDLITYFGDDPYTKSIVIYLETIDDARSFLSAAKEVALSKPIIVLKAGRTATGAAIAAAYSHGDGRADALLDAALQRVGVLRVRTIAELFYMANILATQPLPRGPHLAIITNAIGPAIMATDTLLTSGGKLAEVSADAAMEITKQLPAMACCENPIDLMGDAPPHRYGSVTGLIAREKSTDGLLVILTPQQISQPTETARQIVNATARLGKPVLASWMGGDRVSEGQNVLFEAGIPAFPYPDTPARLFALMWRHSQNLDSFYETPTVIANEEKVPIDPSSASIMLEGIRAEGRSELTEWEAKAILSAYGIPVVQALPAASEDEAVTCSSIFGYPVMLKLLSRSHELKRTIHGVRVSLRSEQDVREGFRSIRASLIDAEAESHFLGVTVQKMVSTKGIELVAGTRIDEQFGPYVYFGTGGQISEFLKDHALGLPPLTTALAQRMIERTRMWQALQAQSPLEDRRLFELQSLLVRLSQLIVQHPIISELEINPLLATADTVVALDARITLLPAEMKPGDLPRPAIRPYPNQYTWRETLRDELNVVIRPVRPEDEPLIVTFHGKLSEETIYRRYFFQHKLTRRTSHERLRRTCFLDYDREIALAVLTDDKKEGRIITAVGRLARNRSGESAEIAIVVADPFQGMGIGSAILRRLLDIARAEGISRVKGTMLPGNMHMQHLFSRLGFEISQSNQESVTASLKL